MSYSYLYVGKTDISLNSLSYLNKIDSIYTSSSKLKSDLNFNIKYYGINNGSNNFQEVWNSYSTTNITLKAQIIYYIYMKESFDQLFSSSDSETNSYSNSVISRDSVISQDSVIRDSVVTYINYPTTSDICNNLVNVSSNTEYLVESNFEGVEDKFTINFEENSKLNRMEDDSCSDSHIVSINIPNSVTKIGEQVFSNCPMLSSVTFENASQLKEIGAQAFVNATSLNKIIIPSEVEELKMGLFNGCSKLSSVDFENSNERPSKIKRIENFVFNSTIVKSLYLPKSVEMLSSYALKGLTNIKLYIPRHSNLDLSENEYVDLYGGKNIKVLYYE